MCLIPIILSVSHTLHLDMPCLIKMYFFHCGNFVFFVSVRSLAVIIPLLIVVGFAWPCVLLRIAIVRWMVIQMYVLNNNKQVPRNSAQLRKIYFIKCSNVREDAFKAFKASVKSFESNQ